MTYDTRLCHAPQCLMDCSNMKCCGVGCTAECCTAVGRSVQQSDVLQFDLLQHSVLQVERLVPQCPSIHTVVLLTDRYDVWVGGETAINGVEGGRGGGWRKGEEEGEKEGLVARAGIASVIYLF